jgi:hypothetical protein
LAEAAGVAAFWIRHHESTTNPAVKLLKGDLIDAAAG